MNQNFPSYAKISSKIAQQQRKQYLKYIHQISNKVSNLRANLNYHAQHRQLIKKMIAAHHQEIGIESPNETDGLDIGTMTKKKYHNAESLNEYLEDSDEDEDNFEAHLKFRKKALERELEFGQPIDNEISKSKGKAAEILQSQKLYRDLFKQTKSKMRKNSLAKGRRQSQLGENDDKMQALEKNKKKLTQLYGTYMDALGDTNMVKWRILS